MNQQIILTWIRATPRSLDLDTGQCTSDLIVEIIKQLNGMGYRIDACIPVLYRNGVALDMAQLIISRPEPKIPAILELPPGRL